MEYLVDNEILVNLSNYIRVMPLTERPKANLARNLDVVLWIDVNTNGTYDDSTDKYIRMMVLSAPVVVCLRILYQLMPLL
jgi:hypothetical protein